ncbi:MAG: RNA polymerase subunit sigma-70 [Burkholderiales bacterium PBB3]|nr:MAG: RNA polymerase subunit sigma-70 [Burkholderiales bacterium PBB3]
MNLLQHPELLERIASSYALGTLRGGARRRFEAMAREQAPVRAAALIWQARLSSLTELQTQAAPSTSVWTRIDNLVRGDLDAAAMAARRAAPKQDTSKAQGGLTGWLQSLLVWRAATALAIGATVVAVSTGIDMGEQMGAQIGQLQAQLQATPQIEYVAVLADDKAAATMLVTFDAKSKKLTLQRVGGYQEANDRSLQLWALPPAGGPRSLGVLGQDKVLRLTANDGDVREVPTLAISLEPKGGVPGAGGPTGPVLFKGALIQKVM